MERKIQVSDDSKYSKEELVAEITAAMMCFQLHITDDGTLNNSIAYLQGWASHLSEESAKSISIASNEAKKACDFISKFSPEIFLNKEVATLIRNSGIEEKDVRSCENIPIKKRKQN